MVELGRRFRHPGRVYLVGGTTLVYAGLRAQTIDVDLDYEVAPAFHGELIQTLRRLKDDLGINIEEASPAHFIPLPAGYADRARFVGRYGQLDVFHFDPYSMALAKLERGREEDFHDLVALFAAGWLDWPRFEAAFDEILPRIASESLKGDPVRFRRHLDALRRRLNGEMG